MTATDTQDPAAQVGGWLGEGFATWGALLHGTWAEYQILPDDAHPLALILERHLPEKATR